MNYKKELLDVFIEFKTERSKLLYYNLKYTIQSCYKHPNQDINSILEQIIDFMIQEKFPVEDLHDEIIRNDWCNLETVYKIASIKHKNMFVKKCVENCIANIDKESWENFLETGNAKPKRKAGFFTDKKNDDEINALLG